MSIKNYSNYELLQKCFEALILLREKRDRFAREDEFWVNEYERLKEEVLDRMDASNGNNK